VVLLVGWVSTFDACEVRGLTRLAPSSVSPGRPAKEQVSKVWGLDWIVNGVTVGLVPLILTVEPSGGAVPAMLDWRKPTVVKIALPIPIALTIAVAMVNEA
jgi:hypothetical protein